MKKWNIGWGAVSHCNMNCQFCYSKYRRKNSEDLEYIDWINFIDENYSRINTINYGTGENTLDKDWFRLVSYIRKNYPNIRQALTTNGHLAEAVKDPECMQAFIAGIDEVDISLDFYEKHKHNEFRGQPKAYDWALESLELCQKYKKQTTLVFLGSEKNINYENIDGLFEIAKKYGTILRMNMYRPTEGVNDFSKQFIISYNTFVDALKYIADKYHIISMNDALFSSFLTNETIQDPSGDRSIRILADGSITPSTYLIDKNYIVANIKEKNILEKLEKENMLGKIVEKSVPDECKKCIYASSCAGGVYDRRYLWNGTLEKKDPYCPGIFKEKNKELIKITDTNFNSVHDGYLPTIFFKPKEN